MTETKLEMIENLAATRGSEELLEMCRAFRGMQTAILRKYNDAAFQAYTDKLVRAVECAEHTLSSLNGLRVYDPPAKESPFMINTTDTLRHLRAALNDEGRFRQPL